MKSRIATLEAEASAGGTPEYRECVENAYISLRVVTHAVEAAGGHLSLANVTLASGQPAGTLILEYPRSSDTPNPVWDLWHDGPDKDIVRGQIVNVRPATNFAAKVQFEVQHVTTRPLPAGSYTFFRNVSSPGCTFRPPGLYNHDLVNLTVTPPERTLHEAFFDPVAIGDAVGADGSNGVLKSAAFSLDGTTTTITSLKWEDGEVTMGLSPTTTLADYAIDFIDATGTTTLSLSSDNASTTALTWTVPDAPWSAGDLLMLRLHNPAPPPPVTVTITPRPEGRLTFFDLTVSWNDPQACDGRYFVYVGTAIYKTHIRNVGW